MERVCGNNRIYWNVFLTFSKMDGSVAKEINTDKGFLRTFFMYDKNEKDFFGYKHLMFRTFLSLR